MRLKRLIKIVVFAILCVIILYVGACFTGTLTKALTQPHAESIARTYKFMGFYILSAFYGAILLLCIAALIVSFIIGRKKNGKKDKTCVEITETQRIN